MKSVIIPREQLAAYRRWEAVDFDKDDTLSAEEPDMPADTPAPALDEPPNPEDAAEEIIPASLNELPEEPVENGVVEEAPPLLPNEVSVTEEERLPEEASVLPTAADIERMYAEAHQQGYSAGYDEGSAAAKEAAERMETLMSAFGQALAALDQRIAGQLLSTALDIAEQVIRQSLRVKPELLIPVAVEAVNALPSRREIPTLTLHPDDAAIARHYLGEASDAQKWRIVENASITRGGCQVESGAAEIDATLETRWRRVMESIGVDRKWFDNEP